MSVTLASPLVALPAALVAGLLLALLIVRMGRGEFPAGLFGDAMSLGAVMGTLILFLEAPFDLRTNVHGFSAAAVAFGFAGFPEEAAKMAVVYCFLRPHYRRRTSRDLVLSAAASALGFALLENALYVAAAGQHWGALAMARAVTAVPVHVFLGVIGGFAIAQAEFAPGRVWAGVRLTTMWVVVSLLHGFYDWPIFILSAKPPLPPSVGAAADRLGVSAATLLYCVLLSAAVGLCSLAFLNLSALDRLPSAVIDRPTIGSRAPTRGFNRFVLARATGLVVAGLLLVPSIVGLALSAILSFIADQAVVVLLAAFYALCPVTIALMLLGFPPRARAKAAASPIWRRRRIALAAVMTAIALFGAYRWGLGPVRDVIAARIEVKGVQSAIKGDHEAAIREFDRALAFDPTFVDALAKRAASNAELERYDRALADLDRAVLLQPRNVGLLILRSEVYRSLHATPSVIADIDRALAIAPNDPALWAASAHANMEAHNDAKAHADIARALELGPTDAKALKVQAFLFINAGDYDRALRSLDEALRTNANDVDGLFARGRLWLYKQDAPKAAADLERLNAANVNLYPALWLFLARSRMGVDGGRELAARTLRSSNYKWPFPVVRFFLGQMTAAEMRAEAASDDQRCEADFYNGELLLGQGKTEPARAALRAAAGECPVSFVEYEGAGAELRKLDRDAAAVAANVAIDQTASKVAMPSRTGNEPASTTDPAAGGVVTPPRVVEDVSANGSAPASITNSGTRYSGTAVWSFVDRGTSGSELDAVLLFQNPSIHGELSLKRTLEAGNPQYALFFTILASDRAAPPFSQLGARLGLPWIASGQTRAVMPAMSDFLRINDTTYRMFVPSQDIARLLSDLASGAGLTIQLTPTQGWRMTLSFDLTRQTAQVLRVAANAWR
jgi:lipoprotein NlpI